MNVLKCFAVIIDTLPVITKFRPFHSISYGFWVLNFKFKFKNWIFLKWPPFGQFWPDFCQKLISTSFQYTGCSYKILNHFILSFVLYQRHKIFFKLLNLKPKLKFNQSKQYVKYACLVNYMQNFYIACGYWARWRPPPPPFHTKTIYASCWECVITYQSG